jgi:hypothetical protein
LDASLVSETCLEFPSFANLIQDSIHTFTGVYLFSGLFKIKITENSGRLYAQYPVFGDEPIELLLESQTRFFTKEQQFVIEFQKEADGSTKRLKRGMDRKTWKVRRLRIRLSSSVCLPNQIRHRTQQSRSFPPRSRTRTKKIARSRLFSHPVNGPAGFIPLFFTCTIWNPFSAAHSRSLDSPRDKEKNPTNKRCNHHEQQAKRKS